MSDFETVGELRWTRAGKLKPIWSEVVPDA